MSIIQAAGSAGIFHFPYRINAQDKLQAHTSRGKGYTYRVQSPFLVRQQSSPLTEDVPPSLWPSFEWHPNAPAAIREPIAPVEFHYNNEKGPAVCYDGLVSTFGVRVHRSNSHRSFCHSPVGFATFRDSRGLVTLIDIPNQF